MRKNRPAQRLGRRVVDSLLGRRSASRGPLRRAPRRRDVERLESRELLTIVGTPTDEPYFGDQWHLLADGQNVEFNVGSATYGQQLATTDINAVGAWELGYSGAGVQVAIVDGGFDLGHEDLEFVTSDAGDRDLFEGDDDPSLVDVTDASGTAVAGIIGARDNDIGTVGVAYQADLIPIRLNPGDFDGVGLLTIDAINTAFRYGSGQIIDTDGDRIPDSVVGGELQQFQIDLDGDGVAETVYAEDPSNVTDVYYHSGEFIETSPGTRDAVFLPEGFSQDPDLPIGTQISILDAIEETAINGRSYWADTNNNGELDNGEIISLGSIHVVPAGSDAGTNIATATFTTEGDLATSQYNELANSIYTIAVGGVAYDGAYEKDATGNVSGSFETGSNVLVVAPAGFSVDIGQSDPSTAGIVTTDPTGDLGSNLSGVANFEFDGDYYSDTNYTSTLTGSEAAAAQVAGVIALMLEANPLLTQTEVQQILLQSAVQTDEFSETWVVNQQQTFQDVYSEPSYVYYDIDTDGDGEADIENALMPNVQNPNITRGFFLDPNSAVDLSVPWNYDPEAIDTPFVDLSLVATNDDPLEMNIAIVDSNAPPYIDPDTQEDFTNPVPPVGYAPGVIPDQAAAIGTTSPILTIQSPTVAETTPLEFETGSGYTVSQGLRGNLLEEYGYAHGLVDAELAVQLAEIYAAESQVGLDETITVTSDLQFGTGTFRLQPRAFVTDPDGNRVLEIPGGINPSENIDTAIFGEYFQPLGATEIQNAAGDTVAEVITDAPFYDPDNDQNFDTNIGTYEIPFNLDTSVTEDFLTLEWIEVTTQLSGGDLDNLRLAIQSPDGTISELNATHAETNNPSPIPQSPQGQQGALSPHEEIIDNLLGPLVLNPEQTITGSDVIDLGASVQEAPLAAGESWTWTTNRHWGEVISLEAQNAESGQPDDQWTLIVENHGDGEIFLGGQIEFAFHGSAATGNRIQGKIGVDDNAQGVAGLDADENFNFNRYVEFGEVEILMEDSMGNQTSILQQILLDDANDSVTYTNTQGALPNSPDLDNIYKTVDPESGNQILYPVIDRDAYFSVDDFGLTTGGIGQIIVDDFLPSLDNFVKETLDPNLTAVGVAFTMTEAVSLSEGPLVTDPLGEEILYVEEVLSYRNFDYSQETFASGVVVVANQIEVVYDEDGNITDRIDRGVFDKFVTGADGNYYFDVEANPEPPAPGTPAYDAWFLEFGSLFEYEITLEGVDSERILTNEDGGAVGYFDTPETGTIAFDTTDLDYTIAINASEDVEFGATTKMENVNFLLSLDPAETNIDVTGTVYRDRNGDGNVDGFEETYAGVAVFYDVNGNGVFDASMDIETTTDANGVYALTIPGLTSPRDVSIVVDTTFDATLTPYNPADGELLLSVTPGSPVVGADFAFQLDGGEPAQVSGVVFEDVNADGVLDETEIGIDSSRSVTVFLDTNSNGAFDFGEPSSETAADGSFNIESTIEGTFELLIDPNSNEDGLIQTSPADGGGFTVEVLAGVTTSGLLFGLFDDRTQDYGDLFVDAAVNYPTRLEDNGARHVVVPGNYLGAGVDAESNAFETTDGTGDDATGVDDEDGVVLLSAIEPGADLEFEITATGQGSVLNAWIDFNNDGDWDDPGEQIFVDQGLVSGETNLRIVQVTAEVNTAASFYAARFRWGPIGISYDGPANAGEVEDYLLSGNAPILITGDVRQDSDGDRAYDETDLGVSGVVVYYDENLDGVRQVSEPSATTNAEGEYTLAIAATGETDVTLAIDSSTMPAGQEPIIPPDGIVSFTLTPGDTQEVDYLIGSPQGVSGVVFSDENNDGLLSEGEVGLEGIPVQLLDGGDVIATTVTDATGSYVLATNSIGTFQVQTDLTGTEFLIDSTGPVEVAIASGEIAPADDLGVFDEAATFTEDYGDLFVTSASNYPTTASENGARHTVVSGVFLGATVDADPGTLTSSDATADDGSLDDDEDGVTLVDAIEPNSTIDIDITATDTAGVGATLDVWIDFNGDGDWDDPGEEFLNIALVSGVTTTRTFATPADVAAAGMVAARFRWGTGSDSYDGAASSGEVEDYLFAVDGIDQNVTEPGDYNGDGFVNQLDYDTWSADYGATSGIALRSDGNEDGVVDNRDYVVWREAVAAAEAAATASLVVDASSPAVQVAEADAVSLDDALADDEAVDESGTVDIALLEAAIADPFESSDDEADGFSAEEEEDDYESLELALAGDFDVF